MYKNQKHFLYKQEKCSKKIITLRVFKKCFAFEKKNVCFFKFIWNFAQNFLRTKVFISTKNLLNSSYLGRLPEISSGENWILLLLLLKIASSRNISWRKLNFALVKRRFFQKYLLKKVKFFCCCQKVRLPEISPGESWMFLLLSKRSYSRNIFWKSNCWKYLNSRDKK